MQLSLRGVAKIVHTETLQAQYEQVQGFTDINEQYDNNLSLIALDQIILRGSKIKSQTENNKDL